MAAIGAGGVWLGRSLLQPEGLAARWAGVFLRIRSFGLLEQMLAMVTCDVHGVNSGETPGQSSRSAYNPAFRPPEQERARHNLYKRSSAA
jgi:hypothetical protein